MDDLTSHKTGAGLGAPILSECAFVRSKHDLYKGYGTGRIQNLRKGHAKVEFNPSVFMPPPYRSENKILVVEQLEVVDSPL